MDKQYYIDNHIGIFKNFMPNEMIDSYLNYFNKCEQQGTAYPRREDEMLVSDSAINTVRNLKQFNIGSISDIEFEDTIELFEDLNMLFFIYKERKNKTRKNKTRKNNKDTKT